MSYDTSRYYNLTQWLRKWVFSWWLVDNINDIDMAGNNTPYARNFRIDWQSVISRPWHQNFYIISTTWSNALWLSTYLGDWSDKLLVRYNTDSTHKLFTLDELWVYTSIFTDGHISSNNRMRFLNVSNYMLCMNWSDNLWKLTGTTYSIPSQVPTSFAPKFAVSFDWKTVASGRSTNPNTIYFSIADQYDDFNSAGAYQGSTIEQVTWLASTGQALFYFTKNTISVTDRGDIINTWWDLTYNSSYLQTTEWAVNHDGIVTVWSQVFYVSPSNSISKLVRWSNNNGFDVVSLTDRVGAGITNFMSSLPLNQTDCRWYFQPDTNLIHWFFKTSGSSFYNTIVVYDTVHDTFMIDTNRFFYDWSNLNGKNYTLSGIEAKVFRDEYSNDDQWAVIPFEYRTKRYYISGWTFKNTLRESRTLLDMNTIAEITQEIRIDDAVIDTKTITNQSITSWVSESLETGIWTQEIWVYPIWTEWSDVLPFSLNTSEVILLRTKGNLNRKWRKIQWRWKMQNAGGRIKLKEVTPRLETLPPRATPLTR